MAKILYLHYRIRDKCRLSSRLKKHTRHHLRLSVSLNRLQSFHGAGSGNPAEQNAECGILHVSPSPVADVDCHHQMVRHPAKHTSLHSRTLTHTAAASTEENGKCHSNICWQRTNGPQWTIMDLTCPRRTMFSS